MSGRNLCCEDDHPSVERRAIRTVTTYLDVLAVLTWVTLVPLMLGANLCSSQITVCPSSKVTMGFPLMVIVCPSRVTDVPDRRLRGGWWGDVLGHKFRAECERLAFTFWPSPPPPGFPWRRVPPHPLRLNLVGCEGVVSTFRWANVLPPGELAGVFEGEEGGG